MDSPNKRPIKIIRWPGIYIDPSDFLPMQSMDYPAFEFDFEKYLDSVEAAALGGMPNQPPPSGDMTTTTNDAMAHFLEYNYDADPGSGVQEEKKKKPKTWQEKVKKKRDDNLRGFFGYD